MAFLVAIAGGSGAGKSSFVRRLRRYLPGDVSVVALDNYYRDRSEVSEKQRQTINYDAPDALETELLVSDLSALRAGKTIEQPSYDFATHTRRSETTQTTATAVVIVDGILALHYPEVREMVDLRVFLAADPDIRLVRRLRRDIRRRGRDADGVIQQYLSSVRPMHQRYVEPSMQHADIILNCNVPLRAGTYRSLVKRIYQD